MQDSTTAELELAPIVEAPPSPGVAPVPPESVSAEAPPDSVLEGLIERTLPSEAAEFLERLLGSSMPRTGEGERYGITSCGRFQGSQTSELLSHTQRARMSGALTLVERDAERVLYFSGGSLVGANSTVLFERLGRLLYQADVVSHESSSTLVDAEETRGAHALLLWIPSGHLGWAVERRLWEVVAAVHFIKRGHFVFVEGEPELTCPRVSLDPGAVAAEGRRRHEAFRNGPSSGETYHPASMPPPPAAVTARMRPVEISADALDVVLRRIRDAETGFLAKSK